MENSAAQLSSIPQERTFFGRSRLLLLAALLVLVGLGLALRLIKLTEPPLDVHGWRQLRSAAIARSMYYQMLPSADAHLRQMASYLAGTLSVLESPVLERIVALTYLVIGREAPWVGRLYSILFWMVGGLALYDLARRLTSVDGALVALAYYLLLPFANTHSRTFMPDPFMVMWILLALNAGYRWTETPHSWKWAILTGLFAGLAVLVKVFAVFPLFLALGLLVLASWGWRRPLRDPRFWSALALMVVIPSIYYLVAIPGRGANYLATWTLPYLHLLTQWTFYVRWLHRLLDLFNLVVVLAAFASLVLLPKRGRALAAGLWAGYIVMGMTVPSLITSHIYYNLVLTPVIALCLAPLAALFLGQVARQQVAWRLLVVAAMLVGMGDAALFARKELTAVDYSLEPAFWQDLAARLPKDGNIVALAEDYNTRLLYYGWRYTDQYPFSYDQDMYNLGGGTFDVSASNWTYFKRQTRDDAYFLVTVLSEFDAQPYLKSILYGYYPVVMQGERYVLFDLRHPLKPIP